MEDDAVALEGDDTAVLEPRQVLAERGPGDADHLGLLVYDPQAIDEAALGAALEEARRHAEPIPEYAYDCHTATGKRRGKTRTDFLLDEFDALSPREPGLFDADLETLRTKKGGRVIGRRPQGAKPGNRVLENRD